MWLDVASLRCRWRFEVYRFTSSSDGAHARLRTWSLSHEMFCSLRQSYNQMQQPNQPPFGRTVEPIVERVEKPVVVHERVLPTQRTEVQPVIHRDREQVEYHEVLQPMKERDIAPTQVQRMELPAQRFETRAPDTGIPRREMRSDICTAPMTSEQSEKAPIVEEVIHKRIIEEVQPVLYKETLRPVVVQATKPIFEHIVESPTVCEEVRPMVDLGTKVLGQGVCTPGVCAPAVGTPGVCAPSYATAPGEPVKMIIREKTTVLQPEGQAPLLPKRLV
jgi:hypothetical protein